LFTPRTRHRRNADHVFHQQFLLVLLTIDERCESLLPKNNSGVMEAIRAQLTKAKKSLPPKSADPSEELKPAIRSDAKNRREEFNEDEFLGFASPISPKRSPTLSASIAHVIPICSAWPNIRFRNGTGGENILPAVHPASIAIWKFWLN